MLSLFLLIWKAFHICRTNIPSNQHSYNFWHDIFLEFNYIETLRVWNGLKSFIPWHICGLQIIIHVLVNIIICSVDKLKTIILRSNVVHESHEMIFPLPDFIFFKIFKGFPTNILMVVRITAEDKISFVFSCHF